MDFQIGDKVIHKNYGLGEIVQLDEKVLAGRSGRYYVVEIRDLTIWVPMNDAGECNLRLPTPRDEFKKLLAILRSPGEMLSNDRLERRTQLLERMNDGNLESICRVVRDLSYYRQEKKLNEHDVSVLERAQNFLLSEWNLVLSVSLPEAERELNQLLKESPNTSN